MIDLVNKKDVLTIRSLNHELFTWQHTICVQWYLFTSSPHNFVLWSITSNSNPQLLFYHHSGNKSTLPLGNNKTLKRDLLQQIFEDEISKFWDPECLDPNDILLLCFWSVEIYIVTTRFKKSASFSNRVQIVRDALARFWSIFREFENLFCRNFFHIQIDVYHMYI